MADSYSVTTRYADYVETAHQELLASMSSHVSAVIDDSPFADYTVLDADSAFFGTGYLIGSFPSLYDMYGKFMAGLDIEVLWSQALDETLNDSVINDLVAAEAALMDDDISMNAVPKLQTSMRDVNSVMTSTFVVGKAVIEDSRVKALERYRAEAKYNLLPLVQSRWQTHLDWNKSVIGVYAEIMKLYFSAKTDVNEVNYSMLQKNKLWPFTPLEYQRTAVAAMQGAIRTQTDVAGASTASKVLSGALSGAAMGALVGGSITASTPGSFGTFGGNTYAGGGALLGAGFGIAAALTY